ncbi:MAG TPA: HlyD family efflux transporter periplasmic adaptor subunit [Burkholderiaceae bacterium]|nr:HlyD family efflux transporter periplasmic adaptor subunit [Burkholderiaceae bacterium]
MRSTTRFAARSARDAASHNEAQARAALESVRPDGNGHASGQALAVIAPISGRVLRVLQQSEAVLAMGTPLLEVAKTEDLEVVVDVLSTEALRIAPGMAVKLDAGGGVRFEGVVRRVEPSAFTKVSALGVEEQRVNVIVDLRQGSPSAHDERDAPDKDAQASALAALGDGFRVDARILTEAHADALLVPVAALFRHEGDWAVFVVSEGRASLRLIKVGGRNLTEAWVFEGLQAGDTVVVYPGDLLEDGARVKPF